MVACTGDRCARDTLWARKSVASASETKRDEAGIGWCLQTCSARPVPTATTRTMRGSTLRGIPACAPLLLAASHVLELLCALRQCDVDWFLHGFVPRA